MENFSEAVEKPVSDAVEEYEADVVVVGGGGSGSAAAIAANQGGAKVILLEKGAAIGGQLRHVRRHGGCGQQHAAGRP